MIKYKYSIVIVSIILSIFLLSCSDFQPKEIAYGQELCDYCNMNIVQAPFAAQMITSKGKILLFDSIECMVALTVKKPESYQDAHSLWVTDFSTPGTFVTIDKAQFMHGGSIKSPMGVGILAFDAVRYKSGKISDTFGGKTVSWAELEPIVKEAWNLD